MVRLLPAALRPASRLNPCISFARAPQALKSGLPVAVLPHFADTPEQARMFAAFETILRSRRVEDNHVDALITNYREAYVNPQDVPVECAAAVARMRQAVEPLVPNGSADILDYVHLLELQADGVIAPHVDNPNESGHFVCGLNMGSETIMTLSTDSEVVQLRLAPGSLYVLAEEAQTEWKHAIWADPDPGFDCLRFIPTVGDPQLVARGRRLVAILRGRPLALPAWKRAMLDAQKQMMSAKNRQT
eukprot:TRINITY_DN86284_c0_g1_i1.p1 TRINITY_DN86284_c0_g1~~TRINITY_DN86284_c0_g1_i1.p1  ORF type:complete len:253 (+),score=38.55 TRINITY_DN86284_c0_g1_i1:23-760(+)